MEMLQNKFLKKFLSEVHINVLTFFGKDIMKTKLSKIILLVPVLVTVLYYLFGHIQYFVVDDQLMNYIVDGVYGNERESVDDLAIYECHNKLFHVCFKKYI